MTQLQPRIELAEQQGAADLAAVDGRIAAFFAERIARAGGYGDEYLRLWCSARAAADGGKRIRPRFVLSAFRALSGAGEVAQTAPLADAALDTAVAFELLHTAFLLHDDVIDGDTVRRGRPNIAGEFSADAAERGAPGAVAQLWGESAAILAGDLLIHAASSLVARLDVPAAIRGRLLDVLDHSVFVTAAGELADVRLSTGLGSPELADVLRMTEHKTAAYSVAGPLLAGAILAGAEGELLDRLAEYGRLVGIAFQLGDDILGVFGTPDVTGKSILSDLREGKETTLIAYARSTTGWPAVSAVLERHDPGHDDAEALAAALETCGARRFVEDLLGDHVSAALALLDSPEVPQRLAAPLADLARSCIGRTA
ncbi:polyprenyl synthetase family protein [Leifsonia sp. F6_8S_P_1B]|uniref:Polyprenyl synthetase family protein n=1 Tax=Leifsonia williamsii TaxID=3035919 RepID=A0ABT8KDX8_9MICO|nr:polyprenyl synthetase family protein [Leifsonia williamsii]MDN4615663.1 polyprenyl synthetase family protein [Leifsonia williamsii]